MKIAVLVCALGFCSLARADVRDVRREVARIDAAKLSIKSHEENDLSAEGARISVYRDARKRPRKIIAHIYGESGRAHETIYLSNGLPVFFFRVEERYQMPLGTSPTPKVASRTEIRLYFEGRRLLEKRTGRTRVVLSAAQRRVIEQQTRAAVKKYLASTSP